MNAEKQALREEQVSATEQWAKEYPPAAGMDEQSVEWKKSSRENQIP
jgi:hypothetical protein